jgi:predicted GNAT family acetyltransferase
MTRHPLDRPVWSALATRQRDLAVGDDLARRFDPAIGPFAAIASDDTAHLARLEELIAEHGPVVLLQRDEIPTPPGTVARLRAAGVQLVLERLRPAPAPAHGKRPEMVPLGADDAAEMIALAKLTEPGPFESRTPELGGFLGVRVHGRLVAMAGERMKPEGFTEVSGVCTHPDHRGRGYAAMLSAAVADRILARGETPFLHAFASNRGAIALYERLGFVLRTPVEVLALVPGARSA